MNFGVKMIHIYQPGAPEVMKLIEGPRPTPKAGEVLIRVQYAGVNRPDVMQRKGVYPPPPGASPIAGLSVWHHRGSRRWSHSLESRRRSLRVTPGGGYAEFSVAPAGQVLPVPKGILMEEAAGIPETFFTVWTNVFERGRRASGRSHPHSRRKQRDRHHCDSDRARVGRKGLHHRGEAMKSAARVLDSSAPTGP